MSMEKVKSWLATTYDRLIAVVILAVLIVSLLYLAVKIGVVRAQQAAWEAEIVNLVPDNPEAAGVTPEEYELAMSRLDNPHIIPVGTWSRRLIVPEERFWCEDCRYPNPMKAEICASCKKELDTGKLPADFDEDKDGIPNLDEETYGLDPLDPDDAELDKDGDGFSNLLEHNKGTDPRDPQSKPSIEAWIALDNIEAEAFNLLFKAYSTLPDGRRMFQLNTRRGGKTHFVSISNQVENFVVTGFATNTVSCKLYMPLKDGRQIYKLDVPQAGKDALLRDSRTVGYTLMMLPKGFAEAARPTTKVFDLSKLTLRAGMKDIVLTKGVKVQWDKFNATLIYDRTGQKFMVHQDDIFELEGNKYKVIRIDTSLQTVVLNRIPDNKEFKIEATSSGVPLPPAEQEDTDKGAEENVEE